MGGEGVTGFQLWRESLRVQNGESGVSTPVGVDRPQFWLGCWQSFEGGASERSRRQVGGPAGLAPGGGGLSLGLVVKTTSGEGSRRWFW